MKSTRILMGMPITVEIIGRAPAENARISEKGDDTGISKTIEDIFDYFRYVDENFSVFKENSEISRINRGLILMPEWSKDMKAVFELADRTKQETNGFFNIRNRKEILDPSGIVKGWAILSAARIAQKAGFRDYYVEAGGDIQVSGQNKEKKLWRVGIKNPFKQNENVKIIELKNMGIATSGTYIRGQHIYNPFKIQEDINDIVSLTIIGPDVLEADRFATAAFAMGKKGIAFLESVRGIYGLEGYMIDSKSMATMTGGFERFQVRE